MSTTDTALTPLRKRRPTPAASPSGVPLGTNTGGVSKRQRLSTGNVLPRSDNLDSSETEDEEPMRRTVQLPAQAGGRATHAAGGSRVAVGMPKVTEGAAPEGPAPVR